MYSGSLIGIMFSDETRSVCYSIKEELEAKFWKEEETKENEIKWRSNVKRWKKM